MGSPFQRAFSSKSPLNQHKEVKKLLKQAKRENPQDRDYERIADLETEFGNAKLAHKNNSSKKQDVAIVEIERKNSMDDASMSRKQSPLNHRDKTGKPIQGDYPGNKQGANHSHPNPIDTSNLSHFDKKPKEQKPKPKKSLEAKAKEILAKKK